MIWDELSGGFSMLHGHHNPIKIYVKDRIKSFSSRTKFSFLHSHISLLNKAFLVLFFASSVSQLFVCFIFRCLYFRNKTNIISHTHTHTHTQPINHISASASTQFQKTKNQISLMNQSVEIF